ncbi:MAG: GatB/YqeY domain-containing protein [Gammaproteobacteria bacterium]|nr:GatB/YqeY domain-containing protein [Gammaproteobacteria bacterium]MCW8910581.1 GatB/YqeY domain-containing protein [Gammaproteobacteria bacterium]MCW9006103.1 GatB/YqeY domain-containing protein [Gammaproteobacteria bacterium]MCW9056481.1 GatB/YqeY domain-containing protein [Gammaproteobacteria bacterium]
MSIAALKQRIQDDMKTSMKSGDKARLQVIRLILSAIKQIEVDERIELDDDRILAVLDKMTKQRRESADQYEKAQRDDLLQQEMFEIEILKEFLPAELSSEEIEAMIEEAISSTGASTIKDMGKVMGQLKPKMQGRADMGAVSGKIKSRLNAA